MKIVVNTPDKIVMRILFDIRTANGRPLYISISDVAQRLDTLGLLAQRLYAVVTRQEREARLVDEVRYLSRMGFVKTNERGDAELTGAGEFIADAMEYPHWAHELADEEPMRPATAAR